MSEYAPGQRRTPAATRPSTDVAQKNRGPAPALHHPTPLQRALAGSPRVRQLARTAAMLQRESMPEEELQAKRVTQRLEEDELVQGKRDPAVQRRAEDARAGTPTPNQTGMPDNLKSGIEALSGFDMSDVRVHSNSPRPASVDALAYASGNEIHLGPGQEHHLPHEAWHVVQQRQGRVQPTMQLAGVAVNDDAGLEAEADAMGRKALDR